MLTLSQIWIFTGSVPGMWFYLAHMDIYGYDLPCRQLGDHT